MSTPGTSATGSSPEERGTPAPSSKPRGGPSALRLVGPAVVYVAYIFVMGSVRNGEPPMHVSDKTAHLVAFGLMVPLFVRALRHFRPEGTRVRLLLAAMGLASFAGALLEVWQSFLPYRSADVLDWTADTLGAVLAGALVVAWWRLRR